MAEHTLAEEPTRPPRMRGRAAGKRAEISHVRPRCQVGPTFRSRYECKYTVDPALLGRVRAFIAPFTEPDRHAAGRPGCRYPVNSLYLDNDGLALYWQTVGGEKDRFKLRVRTYDDDPQTAAYFEVKRKMNGVVHKRRAALSRPQARAILRSEAAGGMARIDGQRRRDLEYFTHHASMISARPLVRIKYLREAYQSTANEPVRITIDTDLEHAVTFNEELRHAPGRWVRTPLDGAIVEIKFTSRFPSWIQSLVQQIGMHQRAVPKYVLCVDHMLREGCASATAVSGRLLPPRGH